MDDQHVTGSTHWQSLGLQISQMFAATFAWKPVTKIQQHCLIDNVLFMNTTQNNQVINQIIKIVYFRKKCDPSQGHRFTILGPSVKLSCGSVVFRIGLKLTIEKKSVSELPCYFDSIHVAKAAFNVFNI